MDCDCHKKNREDQPLFFTADHTDFFAANYTNFANERIRVISVIGGRFFKSALISEICDRPFQF